MAQQQQQNMNAQEEAAKRIPSTLTVGEGPSAKVYKIKRSGKAVKEIMALVPDDEAADDPVQNLELLYAGLALLVVDDQGQNPDPAVLEEELDFEIAQDLMEKLLPRRAEGNVEPTSAGPSTPASSEQT